MAARSCALFPVMAVFGLAPAALWGQARDPSTSILSDRPGLGDGSHVLAPGVWQAEVGAAFMGDVADGLSLGQGLVRGGFAAFDLRLYANSIVLQDGAAGSDTGLEDVGVGAKVPLGGSGSWNWAALGVMTLPTGADGLSAGEVTSGGAVIGETSLSGSVGLALNAGYFFPVTDPGEGSFAVILTPGFGLPGVDDISAYAGVASYFGHGDDTNFVEAGLAYARDADTQLDVNWGIDTDSRAWFLGVGWAHRWR